MLEIKGQRFAKNASLAIVVARFNDFINKSLLEAALEELKRSGVAEESITVVWVPGAFEIPLIAMNLAQSEKYQAVIWLYFSILFKRKICFEF